MTMLGNLSDFALPDILQMFERAKKSGMLSIWSPIGIYRVWFYQGRVTAAISPDKKYSLLNILIGFGALPTTYCLEEELIEPLGSYLRKAELITPAHLTKGFRRQMAVGFYGLFSLTSGQFKFSDNTPIPYEEMTGLSKGCIEAAMEGLRQADTMPIYVGELPDPNSTFRTLSPELPTLQLSALEWKVWEQISPGNTLTHIAEQTQQEILEVRKVASRMMRVGLIEASQPQLSQAAATTLLAQRLQFQSGEEAPTRKVAETATHPSTKVATNAGSKVNSSAPAPVNAKLLNRFKGFLKNIT